MGNQKNTILLNGKVYDAKTGAPLKAQNYTSHSHTVSHHHPKKGTAIDGFIAHPKNATLFTAHTKKRADPPKQSKPEREHAPVHLSHHKPQHTKTLMRHAVKKPARALGHSPAKPIEQTNNRLSDFVIQPDNGHLDKQRVQRAKQVSQSELISRFGSFPQTKVIKKSHPLAVKTPPKAALARTHAITPVVSFPIPEPSPQPLSGEDLFSHALKSATSHEQPTIKSKKHRRLTKKLKNRTINIVFSVLAVLALGGFITYQNIPNLEMRIARARSGVNASLPAYKPSGFSFSGVHYNKGEVSVSYHSNSDNRNFTVTQSLSNWNSETLLHNHVEILKQPVQTVVKQGKTIFVYGDANATWVDGGVWYQVAGNSALNSDQVLKIADSL